MSTLRIKNEDENKVHFLTLTTIEWIDIFTKHEYFHIIIDSLKYCQKNKGLLLYEYVIMTNHIHLVADAKEGNRLSQIISDFKKYTTREILDELGKDNRKFIKSLLKNSFSKKKNYDNQVWQRENYPELIESEKFYLQKAEYIHNNPVKKYYVEKPEDWIYSSARNRIAFDNTIIEVDSI